MSLVSQIELIDYECITLSDDTTGQIQSAWITVRGRVVSVNVEREAVHGSSRERDRLEGFKYRVRRVGGREAYGFIPDEHAACFDGAEEYFCLHVANREERDFSHQLFVALRKSFRDGKAFERVGVSDREDAWDFIGYREQSERLFDTAQEQTIKLV